MALPKINVTSIETVLLPVLNKEVKFRPYTMGEEKSFIIAIDKNDSKVLYNSFKNLIKKCIIDDIDLDDKNFSMIDFMTLVYAMRSKSKSETISLKRVCTKCEKTIPIDIPDIMDILKIKNNGKLKETVIISDTLSIELKPMEANYMCDFLSVMRMDTTTDEDLLNLGLSSIGYNISKIIYEDKIYNNWTIEELKNNILLELTEKQIKKISKSISTLISIYFELDVKCPECEHEEVVIEENFFALL